MTLRFPLRHQLALMITITLAFELTLLSLAMYLLSGAEKEHRAEMQATRLAGYVVRTTGDIAASAMIIVLGQLSGGAQSGTVQDQWKARLKEDTRALKVLVDSENMPGIKKRVIRSFVGAAQDSPRRIQEAVGKLSFDSGLQVEILKGKYHDKLSVDEQGNARGLASETGILGQEIVTLGEQIVADTLALRNRLSEREARQRGNLIHFIHLAMFAALLVSIVVAHGFRRTIQRRLSALSDAAKRFSANIELKKPLRDYDEIGYLDRFFRDTLERISDSRKRESAVIEQAADVICTLMDNGQIESINLACHRQWGYAPEDLMGSRIIRFIPSDQVDSVFEKLKNIMRTESGRFEAQVATRDGRRLDTNWTVVWSSDERTFSCIIHDVTERKRLEKLKRDFLCLVRDEIHVPLNRIRESMRELSTDQAEDLPERVEGKVKIVGASVERLVVLLHQLSDLEDLQLTAPVVTSQTTVKEIVRRSILATGDWAKKQNVALASSGYQGEIDADEEGLVRVLVNLISNAVKFSPRDSTVEIVCVDGGSTVEFQIIDKGPGIPAEKQHLLFQKFVQLEGQSAETKRKGTGLGLTICKSIVENHNGSIGVTSTAGSGSTFWFKIPKTAQRDSESQ